MPIWREARTVSAGVGAQVRFLCIRRRSVPGCSRSPNRSRAAGNCSPSSTTLCRWVISCRPIRPSWEFRSLCVRSESARRPQSRTLPRSRHSRVHNDAGFDLKSRPRSGSNAALIGGFAACACSLSGDRAFKRMCPSDWHPVRLRHGTSRGEPMTLVQDPKQRRRLNNATSMPIGAGRVVPNGGVRCRR